MNFLGAELLLAFDACSRAEEDLCKASESSFWMLAALVEDVCEDYYDDTLSGLRVDIGVADELMRLNLPDLSAHLDAHGVSLAPVLVELMMTLCMLRLPRAVAHVWWSCLFACHNRDRDRACDSNGGRHDEAGSDGDGAEQGENRADCQGTGAKGPHTQFVVRFEMCVCCLFKPQRLDSFLTCHTHRSA
jgi:hypothetical protein